MYNNLIDLLLSESEGKVCHPECKGGCWGKGNDQCFSCKNFRVNNTNICLKTCFDVLNLFDSGNMICLPCHKECTSKCTGPVSLNTFDLYSCTYQSSKLYTSLDMSKTHCFLSILLSKNYSMVTRVQIIEGYLNL